MLVLLLQQLQDALELLEVVRNPKVELILEVFKVLKLYLDKV
jgi:hypothetical protein